MLEYGNMSSKVDDEYLFSKKLWVWQLLVWEHLHGGPFLSNKKVKFEQVWISVVFFTNIRQ